MKGPPVAPGKIKIKAVTDLKIEKRNNKNIIFWNFKGDADFFRIDIARIDCDTCPAYFKKLSSVGGDKRFFEFSGYEKGNYRLRITAVKERTRRSDPVIKDFSIK